MAALIIALLEAKEHSETINKCLKESGHDLIVVKDFMSAKTLLKQGPCDLILSDVHLQNGGNVFDFLKWVKADPALKKIPFVMLSVEPTEMAKYLGDGVRYAARILGASKYIAMEKFDSVLLIKELSELLTKPGASLVSAPEN